MTKSYEASGKTVDEAIDIACVLAGTTIENVEIEILELGAKGIFGFGHKDARVRVTVEEKNISKKIALSPNFSNKKGGKEYKGQKLMNSGVNIRPDSGIDQKNGTKAAEKNDSKTIPCSNNGISQEKNTIVRKNQVINKGQEDLSADNQPKEKDSFSMKRRQGSLPTMIKAGEMERKIFEEFLAFSAPIFSKLGVNPEYRTEIKEGILWIILSGEKLGLLIGRRGETLNALQYLVNLAVNRQRIDHIRIVVDVEGYREGREHTLSALAHKMADKAIKSGRRVELEPMNPHERRIVHMALQNDKRVETSSRGEEPYRRVVVTCRRYGRRGNCYPDIKTESKKETLSGDFNKKDNG